MLIVICRLCVIYVREDINSSVQVMITHMPYMDYMDLAFRCPKRLLNLITHSLTGPIASFVISTDQF